jgi:hypothetical protein
MRRRESNKPLDDVTFRCGVCRHVFNQAPERVEDEAANAHHPWVYFAHCPDCGAPAEQAHWEKSLLKAWANATGPKTEEGIAATAKNLEGHPTPEEARRTRFNGMKHGLNARVATYFPSKPDGYAFCKACDVDRYWCMEQPACVKQTQLFMSHHAAFETRDPKHLTGIYADLQGAIMAVLQQILQTIIADGVKIVSPQWYTDKDTGRLVIAEYTNENGERRIINDINAHPLFKPLGELLSRNSLSLADMGMTAKVIEEEQQDMGRLQVQEGAQQALADFSKQQAASLDALRSMMEKAQENRKNDPILIEYQQQNGGN